MKAIASCRAEIKARGQLTIPKKIREINQMEEGQVVSIIPIGDSILVTPQRLALDDARRQIKKILNASGLSVDEILSGLNEERTLLYKEICRGKT